MIRRLGAALSVLAVLSTACTDDPTSAPETSDPVSTAPPATDLVIPTVTPGGAPSVEAAIAALCPAFDLPTGKVDATPLPAELREVASQVETVRGLTFLEAPAAEAIGDEEMDRRLEDSFDVYYSSDLLSRRSAAWGTIGVIPPGVQLRDAYRSYLTGQVVGFYDTLTGELVYLGAGGLGLVERLVLAHEMVHALEDQRFGLERLDELATSCQDEAHAASLGVVEGSAQYFSAQTLVRFPPTDLSELGSALEEALSTGPDLGSVPPFVQEQQEWSYSVGQAFVTDVVAGGDTAALDRTLTDLPTTTEEILHPELYPAEPPTEVEIGDLTAALGKDWGDLDAMHVGEAWLAAMLGLRIPGPDADAAAAGWDGGGYRAFSDGQRVAVVLATTWDSEADAEDFAAKARDWADPSLSSVTADGRRVTMTFGSDERAAEAISEAVGA